MENTSVLIETAITHKTFQEMEFTISHSFSWKNYLNVIWPFTNLFIYLFILYLYLANKHNTIYTIKIAVFIISILIDVNMTIQ